MCETSEDAWVLHDNLTIEDFFWKDGIRIHEGNIVEILDEDPHTAIFVLKNHDFDEKSLKLHSPMKILAVDSGVILLVVNCTS